MNHLTQIRRLLDDVRMQDSPREAGDDILEILVHLRSVEIELQGIAEPPEPGTVAP